VAVTARRFNRYPAYKDSGVEWLGEIPAHWEVKRLKYVAPARISKLDVKLDDAVYVGLEHVESWTGRLLLENQPETVDSVVGSFRAGDVLFGKLRPYLAKVARPDFDGVCTSEILPLRPVPECSQSYLMYELLNAPYIRWLDSLTYGTKMPRVSPDQVASSFVGLPPLPEQRAIAAFLDRETARIDALVAKKERLIALLQEQRTALITRAVTKGLDPTVPMKDSGVEWLGEIPAHWEVKRLKFLLAEPLKYGANEAAELDDPDLPRYVRITDIDESDSLRNDTFKSLPVDVAGEYLLREGDLLFARSGATAGKTFLYRRSWGTCAYAGYLIRARLDTTRAYAEFVRYFTASSSYWQWLSAAFIQATIQNVSAEKYASLVMTQPPYPDQRAIAAFLDRETTRIDALVAKVREAIDRLTELRTALISAAVTGKIDVREEVSLDGTQVTQ
jgi:restriction endonuclease S subunit